MQRRESRDFDASPNQTTLDLSLTSTCGVPIDFALHCSGQVRTYPGDNGYFFQCDTGLSGQIVLSADEVTSTCSGTGMDPDFGNAVFSGCYASN